MADAGNSLAQARAIFPRPAVQTIRESLSSGDRIDFYRFQLGIASSLDTAVTGIAAGNNFDLFLYNSRGGLVRASRRAGNANEAINIKLNAGIWYLGVRWNAGSRTSAYNLQFAANPDRAGETFATARTLFLRPAAQIITDNLSPGDRGDVYRMNFAAPTSLSALLYGVAPGNNFDLYAYNQQGQLFRVSRRLGNAPEGLNLNLTAGTWYLRVQWNAGSRTSNYSLRLTANVDRAGNSLAAARSLGNLSGFTAYRDYVGASDLYDVYRFNLTNYTNFTAYLAPFAATANMRLLNGLGQVIGSTTGGGTTPRGISRQLLPGTYYVFLAGFTAVPYYLRLGAAAVPDQAANDFESARALNVGFRESTFSDYVGVGDGTDFFTFTSANGGDLNLALTGTTANLDINLYDANRNFVARSSLVNGVETLAINNLPQATYFFEIKPSVAGLSSLYTLTTLLAPPDNVGDTVTDATLVTTPGTSPFPVISDTPQVYSDFASGADEDVFKFDFTGQDNNFLSISLGGLSSNLDMEFFRENSDNRIFSSQGGIGQDIFEGTVGAGIYYLRVFSPDANTGSPYDLTMSVASGSARPSITRDVSPNGSSNAGLLTEVRSLSTLFFVANGAELWKTNGSLETTLQVATFESITDMQAVGNALYIAGRLSGTSGTELYRWTPDGTDDGTISLVAELTPGSDSSSITQMTAVENPISGGASYLYFLASPADTPQDVQLYRTDGTTTTAISNAGNSINQLTAIGTTLYYQASGAIVNNQEVSGAVLWRISNAVGGTATPEALTELTQNSAQLGIRDVDALRVVGTDLYFVANEIISGNIVGNREWRRLSGNTLLTLDANNAASSSLTGLLPEELSLAVVENASGDDYAYFTAAGGGGRELFRTNLTTGVSEALPEINTASGTGSNPTSLTIYDGQLFFRAIGTDGDVELYTVANPLAAIGSISAQKVDLFAGTTDSSRPRDFRIANNTLYFVATTSDGTEIYSYDGQGDATQVSSYNLVIDITPSNLESPSNTGPQDLIVVGDTAGDGTAGRLYFTADDGTRGREVWVV